MNGMNGGDGAVVTERAETMSGLSREERRRKRKELKVELEKLKREIRRVDIKLAEAKKGGKGAKKQTSAGDTHAGRYPSETHEHDCQWSSDTGCSMGQTFEF